MKTDNGWKHSKDEKEIGAFGFDRTCSLVETLIFKSLRPVNKAG
jgi:hypothetical protein